MGPPEREDFRPTASIEMLQHRGRLLRAARCFFEERGYLEVETPLLSRDVGQDVHLDPFVTSPGPGGDADALYLQTSPEFAMKRLLAAGAGPIYQVTRAFRRGEQGRRHNPEFTIVEWYGPGDTHREQMQFTEDLVRAVLRTPGVPAARRPPGASFRRTTYREAFQRHAGFDPFTAQPEDMAAVAAGQGLQPPPCFEREDRDAWLNFFLVERVEANLGRHAPEFICDYPASQAMLARVRDDVPAVAERFELYMDGLELCNGYHELLDAAELRRRRRRDAARRAERGLPPLPQETCLSAAMESGLPACAGVALGFDRLVMAATGATSLAEVMAFPFDRA